MIILEITTGNANSKRFKSAQTTIEFEVHTLDYDIEKYDEDAIGKDEQGEKCRYTVYGVYGAKDPTPIYATIRKGKLKVTPSDATQVIVRTYDKQGVSSDSVYGV